MLVSEREACRAIGLHRSSLRYKSKKPDKDRAITKELHRLAELHPRRGYRYIGQLLRKDFPSLNLKRVYRLWRQAGLQVPQKKPNKKKRLGKAENGLSRKRASRPNEVWSYDFLFDTTERGQTLKMMPIIDEFTRECVGLVVSESIKADDVVSEFERLFAERGIPEGIRSDNGPEYISSRVRSFLAQNEVEALFIEPGAPWQNGQSESFNSRFRDEFLNCELIYDVKEGKVLAEEYRVGYNERRLHSALDYKTPATFAQEWYEQNEPALP